MFIKYVMKNHVITGNWKFITVLFSFYPLIDSKEILLKYYLNQEKELGVRY